MPCSRRSRPAASHLPDPRRHRQRQDRGLYPGHRGSGALWAAGDRAGAGDQSHAADRGAFSPPLRRRRRAAQPHERRRSALALAADRRGRGGGGRRGPQHSLRPHAAPGVDCPGRRARIDLQAGNRAPLSRPRRGRSPRGGRKRAAGPRLGHAFAGKLEPRPDGPVPVDRDAAAGLEPPDAGGRHHRPAGRRPAGRQPRQHQPPAAPGDCRRPGRWRPGDPAVESPRLFHAHPVPGLRRGRALPRLRYRPDVPQDRATRPSAICATTAPRPRRTARPATQAKSATGAWVRRNWRRKCGHASPTPP